MPQIFISYSHQDEKWKDWLKSHLSVLEKQGKLSIWDDRQIQIGDDWLPEIQNALNDAHIAILLISRHFLTSDFILGEEIPKLLQRRKTDGLRLYPLIVSPCSWRQVDWLSAMQGYPKDNKPLAGRAKHEIDEQLVLLAEKIYAAAPNGESLSALMPLSPDKIQVSKLPQTQGRLFGREDELAELDQAWRQHTHIYILEAMGGAGKTALMNQWLNNLSADGFRGAQNVYTWSFYSQGSAEDKQASADEFFNAALNWFGYQGPALLSAHDKGMKLAALIQQQRALVILDGLEPLQYPLQGAMAGAIRDQGLTTLFKQLAAHNPGLLFISSRQPVTELQGYAAAQVNPHRLAPLSPAAGIALFKAAGITGTDQELIDAVTDYQGHALSLNLLANYLGAYEDSDIRQRTNLKALTDFPEAHALTEHAFKVMAAYEKQLAGSADCQVLYLLGLFDRPATAGAIDSLRSAELSQLSDRLKDEKIYKAALNRLRAQDLLNKANPQQPDNLDCHPLIREYFGRRLQQQNPAVWQLAHQTLYEYYKNLPGKQQPDSLAEMEPLFAAIAHGCAAGMPQQALDEVYWPRVRRNNDHYLCKKLGAFGADLSAVAFFFEQHWQTPAAVLTDEDKAAVLNWAASDLRALGRLQEAAEPMQASLDMAIKQEDWKNAAIAAGNLSELRLTLGELSLALAVAEQSVHWADKSRDEFQCMSKRTTLADAQHQSGDLAAAAENFAAAEALQKQRQAEYPQLYALGGFRYCDLLLTRGEWREVLRRAEQTLEYRHENWYSLLHIALDQLSLGRAYLQQAISLGIPATENNPSRQAWQNAAAARDCPLENLRLPERIGDSSSDTASLSALQQTENRLNQALVGLRKAGAEHHLPRGLLALAGYRRVALSLNPEESKPNLEPALQYLQECRGIAERSGMRLFLADYHLEAARLATVIKQPVLKQTAAEHKAAASQLIEETGYKRRLPELANL